MSRHRLARQWLSFALTIAALTSLSTVVSLAAPVAGAAPRVASDATTAHTVRLDSPAIVRIVTDITGGIICHGCASDGSDIVSPASGAFEVVSAGSGAFISSDGYILTADHVVDHNANNAEDVSAFYNAALSDLAQRYGVSTTDADTFLQQHSSSLEAVVQPKSQTVYLSTYYTGSLQNTAQVSSYQVTRIVANSPINKQDTAIIKVEAQDMPYLTLGSSSAISVGDTVTAIAFPADADVVLNGGDFTSLLSPTQSDINTINSLLTPTVETGQLTAKKSLQDGTPIYETNGISSQGSSGGPVIDNQGAIIGFVDSGPTTDRVSNLIPSTVAAEYAQQAGVAKPNAGNFMALWTKAITDYDATASCHWTHANNEMKQLHDKYPSFGAVNGYLQTTGSKATPSECPASSGAAGAIIGVVVVLIILAAIGVGLFFLLRRRKQATPAYAVVPSGAQYSPMQQLGAPNTGTGAYGQQSYSGPQQPVTLPGTISYPMSQPPSATPMPTGQAPAPTQSAPYALPSTTPPTAQSVTPMQVSQPMTSQPATPSFAATGQSTPFSQPTSQPGSGVRMCTAGHVVHDPVAQFCPTCGAHVVSPPQA